MSRAVKFWNAVAALIIVGGLFVFPWWLSAIIHVIGSIITLALVFASLDDDIEDMFEELFNYAPTIFLFIIGGQLACVILCMATGKVPPALERFNNWLNNL